MLCTHLLHQLQVSARRQTPSQGKKIHAQILKLGLQQCEPLPNNLINMYGKCGLLQDAIHLFDQLPQRDPVSWDSILSAHNQANLPHLTLSIFPTMFERDNLQPDHFIFATLVKACAALAAVKQGKQVHARFVLSPFRDDDVVKSSLVDLYAKCGLPDDTRLVFDSISRKNSVSWTAMVSGYARNGRNSEAFEILQRMPERNLLSWTALISGLVQIGNEFDGLCFFMEMRKEGIKIGDPFVLSSIVGASANLAALEMGKQLHCLVIVLGYECSTFVSNALLDMYAKCGDIGTAKGIFNKILQKDVVSWTAIIVGAAQHGRAEEALNLFNQMVSTGLKPNEITFVGLLYACSHVGSVSQGRSVFDSMIKDYGISPSLQHYTCLLDILSRSGHLEEAENLINAMPFKPDEPTWAALLSACKQYGNTKIGLRVANHVLSLKPKDPSTYVLLSNTYARAGMWDNVANVRKLMTVMAVKKGAGYSYIDLGKETQVFYAGEPSQPIKNELFGLLKELDAEMKKRGYVPDTSFLSHD